MATPNHPSLKAYQKRRKAVSVNHQKEAFQMYLSGYSITDIASKIGVGFATVTSYLNKALEEEQEALKDLKVKVKEIELKRLDLLQAAYYEKAMSGDKDSFLVVHKIMERRAKYLGLDSPTEIKGEVNQKVIVGMTFEEWEKLTSEE